jgi:hypothetical protein
MPTYKQDSQPKARTGCSYIKFTEEFEEFLNQEFIDNPDTYTSYFIGKVLTTFQSQFPDEEALFIPREKAVKKLTRWFINKRYYLRKKKRNRKVEWEDIDEAKQHHKSD